MLINVPGAEAPRWNFGISGLIDATRSINENQVLTLLKKVHLDDAPIEVTTLAAYSTGYGSLNQTVNEDLIPSRPAAAAPPLLPPPAPASSASAATLTASSKNQGPDEVDAAHAGSAFNTQRARRATERQRRAKRKSSATQLQAGEAPLYLNASSAPKPYTVEFSVKVNLRAPAHGFPIGFAECLYALALTRCLAFAQVDGQVKLTEVPPASELSPVYCRARGTVASHRDTKGEARVRPNDNIARLGKSQPPTRAGG